MLESTIEKHMVDGCKARGVFALKNTGMGGIPDRLLVKGGRYVWAELKAPGRKPTDLQQEIMIKLRQNGAVCLVIDSKAGVDETIDAICDANNGAARLRLLEQETKTRFPYARGTAREEGSG